MRLAHCHQDTAWGIRGTLGALDPRTAPVDGLMLIGVPTRPIVADDTMWWRARGWRVIAGLMASNDSPEGRNTQLMSSRWNEKQSNRVVALADEVGHDGLAVDLEPSCSGPDTDRYITDPELLPRLVDACWPWQQIGPDETVFLLPAGPWFLYTTAVALNLLRGGTRVVLCDELTYHVRCTETEQNNRKRWAEMMGCRYMPLFRGRVLANPSYTDRLERTPDWGLFFAGGLNGPDDFGRFGTPEWKPVVA